MGLNRKYLLGFRDLEVAEIKYIFNLSQSFMEINDRAIKNVPALRRKTLLHLFHEPGARTRTSLETAVKRPSADTSSLNASAGSRILPLP